MGAEKIKKEKKPILIHDNGQVWFDKGKRKLIVFQFQGRTQFYVDENMVLHHVAVSKNN